MFHGPTLVAPRQLSLWVSDALVRLRWRHWGRASATATGAVTEHRGGRYRYFAASVAASRVGRCGGRAIYTRLSYRTFGRWHSADLKNCRFTA